MTKRKRKKNTRKNTLISGIVIVLLIGAMILYKMYDKIYGPNVHLKEEQTTHLYIPTGSTMEDVARILDTSGIIQNLNEFEWLAEKKNYPNNIHPGRYLVENRMSNNQVIDMLRSGNQDPVVLTFHNIRMKQKLAGIVSRQLEADSADILHLLNDKAYLGQFDFTPETVKAMIIPNTYEFWWNTSAEEFMKRMYREYQSFWDEQRKSKAEQTGLTPVEVSTLASIIGEETTKEEELPKIAGVYINRIKKGMRLQADPTIKFAIGDFTVKRILNKHLKIESPYNTYKYRGLPPGPISFPSIAAIKAVLNFENHDYLYFVAKPDFSGYHNFSETHYEHILNAREYRNALNRRDIME